MFARVFSPRITSVTSLQYDLTLPETVRDIVPMNAGEQVQLSLAGPNRIDMQIASPGAGPGEISLVLEALQQLRYAYRLVLLYSNLRRPLWALAKKIVAFATAIPNLYVRQLFNDLANDVVNVVNVNPAKWESEIKDIREGFTKLVKRLDVMIRALETGSSDKILPRLRGS